MSGKYAAIAEKAEKFFSNLLTAVSSKPKVRSTAVGLLYAIMGYLLSQAVIFNEYSPFGIGFVAACGSSIAGLLGALGAIIGYASLWKLADGLKYVAGTVLTCAGMHILKSLPFSGGRFFPSIIAACSAAFVGFVFAAERGFALQDVVMYISEIILVFASAYLYREALTTSDSRPGMSKSKELETSTVKVVSFFILITTSLIALSNVRLLAQISAGKVIAIIVMLFAAFNGGFGMGSATGVSMGIAFDLAGGSGFHSMAYGFSALIAGVFSKAGKLAMTVAFILTHAVIAIVYPGGVNITSMYETFMASVILILIPERRLPDLKYLFDPRIRGRMRSSMMNSILRQRISGASTAFNELHEAIKSSIDHSTKKNGQDIAKVFDRAAEKVCRTCALKGLCWERDCIYTFNVMNDLTPVLTKKGRITSMDLPSHFVTRCLRPEQLVEAINHEMRSYLSLRRFRNRININRGIVLGQYSEVATILKGVAEDVANGIVEDMEAGVKIERLLHDVEDPSVTVWRNGAGRLHVEIEAADLSSVNERLERFSEEVGRILGIRTGKPEFISDISGDRIRISEFETFGVKIGVASRKRKNSSISGDTGTYFKTEEGMVYVILSDGMGSGREAAIESASVVRLLERFIRAGIETESALRTINSALMLRNIDEGGFATIDLLEINLFTGLLRIFKCGAAPTYIKEGEKIRMVSGKVFPPGSVLLPTISDVATQTLNGGEVLVVMSDGAYLPENDDWLRKELKAYDGSSPKNLAVKISAESAALSNDMDDATIAVIEIVKKEAS